MLSAFLHNLSNIREIFSGVNVFHGTIFLNFCYVIIIEHLPKSISLNLHQSLCRFAVFDMILKRHIKFSMIKTYMHVISIK